MSIRSLCNTKGLNAGKISGKNLAIDATGNYEYLLNKDVNFIRQAYPSPTDTGWIPLRFSSITPCWEPG